MIFRSRVDTGLRSTPVGAEQTSTGRLAPHSAVLTVLERVPIHARALLSVVYRSSAEGDDVITHLQLRL